MQGTREEKCEPERLNIKHCYKAIAKTNLIIQSRFTLIYHNEPETCNEYFLCLYVKNPDRIQSLCSFSSSEYKKRPVQRYIKTVGAKCL